MLAPTVVSPSISCFVVASSFIATKISSGSVEQWDELRMLVNSIKQVPLAEMYCIGSKHADSVVALVVFISDDGCELGINVMD